MIESVVLGVVVAIVSLSKSVVEEIEETEVEESNNLCHIMVVDGTESDLSDTEEESDSVDMLGSSDVS